MTAAKRFYYVYSNWGRRLHMVNANNFSEGNQTYCNKFTQKGWRWIEKKILSSPSASNASRMLKCSLF